MKKSTENPTSEALPQKLPSHFTAQKQRTITEEQTIRRKARLWDRHTRNRCPQDRPQREKGKIARGDCKREDKGSSGKLRGKEGTGQLQGEGLEEKLARQRARVFRNIQRKAAEENSLRRPFIAIPGIPYSLYWNLALISSTDINAPKSTPSQIQIMFVVRLSAPAPLTTLFSIVMLANEKPRTVIALSEQ